MVKKVSVCTQIEQTIKDILRLFREQEEEIIKNRSYFLQILILIQTLFCSEYRLICL